MNQPIKSDTFERLVISLESDERKEMLKQLADISEIQQESIPLKKGIGEKPLSDTALATDKKYLEQPILVRLWFSVLSVFSSTSPTRLFSAYLVTQLGRNISRLYGNYCAIKNRVFKQEFFLQLESLSRIKTFFSSLLGSYEGSKGEFYIILASLMMKQTVDSLSAVSDPFTEPYDREQTKDIRLSRLRDIDSIFQSVPEDERSRMYQSAQAIEWMQRFCAVSFDRMLVRFIQDAQGDRTCFMDSLSDDLKLLSSVLSSAGKVPLLLLEALYLFSIRDDMDTKDFDMEKECSLFVKTASKHLTSVRIFKSSVPLCDILRFIVNDVEWVPLVSDAGEDWFLLLKNAWKKQFEQRWGVWSTLHKRAMLEKRVCAYIGIGQLPSLAHEPWKDSWMPLSFNRLLSLTTIMAFFSNVYAVSIMRPLKILLIEGDFYRRENMVEYTDAFSVVDHFQQFIEEFEARLAPKGDIGMGFALVIREKIATVKNKTRLDSLMLSVDSECLSLVSRLVSALRSIDFILGGVIGVVRGAQYETLINMASIQGKQNEKYRKELTQVKQTLRTLCELLSEIDLIEKEFP